MGLDLYALKLKNSFNQKKLEEIKTKQFILDQKWEESAIFVNDLSLIQNKQTLEDFLNANSENDEKINKFLDQDEIKKYNQTIGLSELQSDWERSIEYGPTSCLIINYYFNNSEVTYWGDVKISINPQELKKCINTITISDNSLSDLLSNQILHPENTSEAIRRILSRKPLDEKDLRIAKFLKMFPNHYFAFL